MSKKKINPEEVVYVGGVVDKLHDPMLPSSKRKCVQCGNDCWVENKMLEIADKAQEIICMMCMLDRLKNMDVKKKGQK